VNGICTNGIATTWIDLSSATDLNSIPSDSSLTWTETDSSTVIWTEIEIDSSSVIWTESEIDSSTEIWTEIDSF
jgi:hypothetical protein